MYCSHFAILFHTSILGKDYYHINIKRVILINKIMYGFVLLWIFWRGLCTRTDAFCPFHETTLMRSHTADCRCFITSTKNRLSVPSISDFIFCEQGLQHLLSWQRVNKSEFQFKYLVQKKSMLTIRKENSCDENWSKYRQEAEVCLESLYSFSIIFQESSLIFF